MPGPTKQEQEPASGEVVDIAPGVLRSQLPIQMPGLGHVNMYILEDEHGAAVVDPGLPTPASWRAIQDRLQKAGIPLKRVHTVVVTHSHPDHFGGARRLSKETGADIVTHEAFRNWFVPDTEEHDSETPPQPSGPPWTRPTPWGGEPPRPPLKRRIIFRLGRSRMAPPTPTRKVRDGETVSLAGRDWVAVHTPGHTPDHLCLFDAEAGLFLSGDHVLPTITPHIGGITPLDDPLASFFASLDRVAALEGVGTVLPAHGHPFDDLAGRVAAIRRHHEERLDVLRAAAMAAGPSTVDVLSKSLFKPRSWGPMADSETFAHLEHLRIAGEAECWEEGGRLVYRVAG